MRTSARNHFASKVSAVKTGAVNDEITLARRTASTSSP